jgi:hypothetical protein
MPPPPPLPPTSGEDKIWIILCHLSLLLGVGFLLPLVVYFVKKQDAPWTAEHAREALNFHICVYVYAFISGLLCLVGIGFLLLPLIGIGSVILSILACIKASDGGFYRYPLIFRLV